MEERCRLPTSWGGWRARKASPPGGEERAGGEELTGVFVGGPVGGAPRGRPRHVRALPGSAPDRKLGSRRPVRQPRLVAGPALEAPLLRLQDRGRSHRGDPQGSWRATRSAAWARLGTALTSRPARVRWRL